jgi:uncharacterized membrane protein YdjX (TVP38/TMEM64 family)
MYAAVLLIAVSLMVMLWWRLEMPVTPAALAEVAAPYRHEWYALVFVLAAFVLLGLLLVPVLLLIAATGVAFGPVLGPLYAMAGSLACGAAGFAIGRSLGRHRVEGLMGERVARVMERLARNGTLTVFVVRKVPAPFTLVNVAIGASPVSFRDFILGTALAMAGGVIALAGFGSQIGQLLRQPSPDTFLRALLILMLSLVAAVVINLLVRSRTAA